MMPKTYRGGSGCPVFYGGGSPIWSKMGEGAQMNFTHNWGENNNVSLKFWGWQIYQTNFLCRGNSVLKKIKLHAHCLHFYSNLDLNYISVCKHYTNVFIIIVCLKRSLFIYSFHIKCKQSHKTKISVVNG